MLGRAMVRLCSAIGRLGRSGRHRQSRVAMASSPARNGATRSALLDFRPHWSERALRRRHTLKAICIESVNDKPELFLREVPQPVPGPQELLVRVKCAGVNFADLYRAARHFGNA